MRHNKEQRIFPQNITGAQYTGEAADDTRMKYKHARGRWRSDGSVSSARRRRQADENAGGHCTGLATTADITASGKKTHGSQLILKHANLF